MPTSWLSVIFDFALAKVILTCLLCGSIGLEREYRQKAAGFRTHLLVGLGATVFTILSSKAFGPGADASRVAAQIVSGVGFIGGGAILRQGLSVRGVTTAASLWLSASIGMAVGAGWLELALTATAVALLALILLSNLEMFLPAWPTPLLLQLKLGYLAGRQGELGALMASAGWRVQRGGQEKLEGALARYNFVLRRNSGTDEHVRRLLAELEALAGLRDLHWEVLDSTS